MLGPDAEAWEIDFPARAPTSLRSLGARLGIAPGDIRYVVNSHLHYDHCGGNAHFPKATLVVHAREWRAAQRGPRPIAATIIATSSDHCPRPAMRAIDGELDLFADGSVMVFARQQGHTLNGTSRCA